MDRGALSDYAYTRYFVPWTGRKDLSDRSRRETGHHAPRDVGGDLERLGGPAGTLVIFAVAYAVLTWLGYQFKETTQQLTIMWPAAGLLFMALWVAESRFCPRFSPSRSRLKCCLDVSWPSHLRLASHCCSHLPIR